MHIDWNSLPGWLVLIPAVLALYLLFLIDALMAYRAGKWEQWKGQPERPSLLGVGVSEEGYLGGGVICIFAALLVYARSGLHWALAIPAGVLIGVGVVVFLSFAMHAGQLSILWIVEKLVVRRR